MYKKSSPFKGNKAQIEDMQEYVAQLTDIYMGAELINPFANLNNEYTDMQNPFLDMPNFYDQLSNQYSDLPNQFSDLSNPYATMTNQFGDLSNPYADLTNQFASLENTFEGMENQYTGMQNRYAGLENVMEDATVNQQQAQFEKDMFQQNQANMLGDLRGAAGGSGIAALAQQMAQSGQLASQQASASIGARETQNQRAALAEAARLQGLEAGEASRIDQLQRGETARIDQMTRQQQGALDMAAAQGQTALDMAMAGQMSANELAAAQGQTALDMAWGQQAAANQMAEAQGQAALDLAAAQGQTALDIGWANQAQANEMAAAEGAWNIDQLIAGEQSNINQLIAGGDFSMQQIELDRLATALGMSQQETAALMQQESMNNQANAGLFGNILSIGLKIWLKCVPKGTKIDSTDGKIAIEDIKPGDVVIGYDGEPVKVLQKHEYLEDSSKKRFYKVKFNNGSVVDVCDMHRIKGVRAKDITEDVESKEIYGGVEFSYDLLTEDLGYRINGIPVNSMIVEMSELITKFKKK